MKKQTNMRAAWRRQQGTLLHLGWEAWAASLDLPGFEKVLTSESWGWGEHAESAPVVEFRGDGVTLRVVSINGWDAPCRGKLQPLSEWSIAASGHTSFTSAQGQRTFDRHGVEDSFYVNPGDTAETMRARFAEQLARVEASRARLARSEQVPGLPGSWTMTPERRAEVTAALLAGRGWDLRPAGFGTGYRLSTRRSPLARLASEEAARWFGVQRLFVESMDCD